MRCFSLTNNFSNLFSGGLGPRYHVRPLGPHARFAMSGLILSPAPRLGHSDIGVTFLVCRQPSHVISGVWWRFTILGIGGPTLFFPHSLAKYSPLIWLRAFCNVWCALIGDVHITHFAFGGSGAAFLSLVFGAPHRVPHPWLNLSLLVGEGILTVWVCSL